MSSTMTAETLPEEAPRHMRHGQKWHDAGLCVTCGGKKEDPQPYHCNDCYSKILPAIFDYDDD